jgi:hypothetical protein
MFSLPEINGYQHKAGQPHESALKYFLDLKSIIFSFFLSFLCKNHG